MEKNLDIFIFALCLLEGFVICVDSGPDPCTTHIILNDTTMDVSYTSLTSTGTFLNGTSWYRYTDNGESILASSCPSGNACGTTGQVWMNATPPSFTGGSALVDTCYKDTKDCCSSKGQVRVKNCKTFLVYMLNPLYGPIRWCFDKALRALPPLPTTTTPLSTFPPSTTTDKALWTTSQVVTTKGEEEAMSPGLIAGICVGVVLGLLLVIILIAIGRYKLRANTVQNLP